MIGVNLISPSIRTAQARRRRMFRWATVLACVAAMGGLPALLTTVQAARLASLEDEQFRLSANLSRSRREHIELLKQIEALHGEIDRATTFRRKREWSGLIALAGRTLSPGMWLESVATDPATPSAAAPPRPTSPPGNGTAPGAGSSPATAMVTIEAPRKLVIRGMSRTYEEIQAYAAKLSSTGVFSSVVLGRSTTASGGPDDVYRFEILCEW